jgi:hypothetical protein
MTGIEQDAFLTRFTALSTHSVDYWINNPVEDSIIWIYYVYEISMNLLWLNTCMAFQTALQQVKVGMLWSEDTHIFCPSAVLCGRILTTHFVYCSQADWLFLYDPWSFHESKNLDCGLWLMTTCNLAYGFKNTTLKMEAAHSTEALNLSSLFIYLTTIFQEFGLYSLEWKGDK